MKYEEVGKMVRRVMPSVVEELDEDLDILKAEASNVVQDLAGNEVGWMSENKIGIGTCRGQRVQLLMTVSGCSAS